jgi:hypothetical protein
MLVSHPLTGNAYVAPYRIEARSHAAALGLYVEPLQFLPVHRRWGRAVVGQPVIGALA